MAGCVGWIVPIQRRLNNEFQVGKRDVQNPVGRQQCFHLALEAAKVLDWAGHKPMTKHLLIILDNFRVKVQYRGWTLAWGSRIIGESGELAWDIIKKMECSLQEAAWHEKNAAQ